MALTYLSDMECRDFMMLCKSYTKACVCYFNQIFIFSSSDRP